MNKRKIKPGSWVALTFSMSVAFIAAKWIARKCSPCVAPLMMLTTFLNSHFSEELDQFGHWVKAKYHGLTTFISGIFKRRKVVATSV